MKSSKNCERCGYDRRGLTPIARCPECGAMAPVRDGDDFYDSSPRAIATAAAILGLIALGQALSLMLIIGLFARGQAQPWLLLGGTILGGMTCLLRADRRLRSVRTRVSGKTIVGLVMIGLTGIMSILWLGTPSAGGGLGGEFVLRQLLPLLGGIGLVIGARAAVDTAQWIHDARGIHFAEHSIWPAAICLVLGIMLGGGLETGNRVTLISVGFLGWWIVQLIGDVLVTLHTTLLIGHRLKLDGIETRRAERESAWSDDLPYPRDS